MKGKIKFYNRVKGFGFIKYKAGNEDKEIFFHHSELKDNIKRHITPDTEVVFNTDKIEKGPVAIDIQLA